MFRALPILLLAGLGCCTYNPRENFSPDFGESVRANIASQVVNPFPLPPSSASVTDGVKMNSAYQRYETNRVYQPRPVQSLQSPSGTSGGGGGGSPPPGQSDGGSGSGGGSSSY